ncbi:hypothetical protein HZA38_04950 [Candidatus Peregrinibacteria bacterium]|nr:hypothetical protein [Candidatus Peregrinibacteria bacterium]
MKKLIFLISLGIWSALFFPAEASREYISQGISEISRASAEEKDKTFLPNIAKTPPAKKIESECKLSADTSTLPYEIQIVFQRAVQKAPCNLLQTLRSVEIVDDPNMPRALGGKYTIKIRKDASKKPEFESVLIHELGHVTDIGGIYGSPQGGISEFYDGDIPVFQDDESLVFYRISWESSEQKKSISLSEDFVSGYAASNPFEDFAESFHLYIVHGNVFRAVISKNKALSKKYEFLKNEVFGGVEFQTGNADENMVPRPWDSTKIGIGDSISKATKAKYSSLPATFPKKIEVVGYRGKGN